MTNSDFLEVKKRMEEVLIETANKPEYRYIHAIARAVWFLLRREEGRLRKEMREWLEEVSR